MESLFLEALSLGKRDFRDILEYVKNNSKDWDKSQEEALRVMYENYRKSLEVERYCPCY